MLEHVQTVTARFQAIRWQPAAPQSPPLSASGLDLLDELGIVLPVRREQEVYGQDDPADYYFQVMSGSLRTVKLMADGRRQVVEFLRAGDLFGFDALDRHDFAVEALEDGQVKRFPRRDVEALAQRSVLLSRTLRDLIVARLRHAHERMLLLGCMTAPQRISSFLLQMADRAPAAANGRFVLAMSRRDIADYLGVTIETVSRTLTQLQRDGTIGMARRIRIEIRDRAALECLVNAAPH